jgi:aspartyl-tRNA(Asn)/glutamyl-tRNA(Gln) amidotransferase subunit C
MDAKTLKEIAYLSRLAIDDKDLDKFLDDFNSIMNYVDQVKELDVSSITESDLYPHHENATREDTIGNSLSRDDISKIAPAYENGYVVVPRVIET